MRRLLLHYQRLKRRNGGSIKVLAIHATHARETVPTTVLTLKTLTRTPNAALGATQAAHQDAVHKHVIACRST